MGNLDLLRKVSLRSRVRMAARRGNSQASEALADFDNFYAHVSDFYKVHLAGADESQTPILDALMRFLEWLDESGLLDILLKLFLGAVMASSLVSTVNAVSASGLEIIDISEFVRLAGVVCRTDD
jgi:hypothetical protein